MQPSLVGAIQAGALVVTKDASGKRVYRLGAYEARPAVVGAADRLPSVEDILAWPIECIPFPDRRRQRAEAVGALVTKLRELQLEQCIPVTPALKPLLREAVKRLNDRTFKVKAIAQGEFCWRVE